VHAEPGFKLAKPRHSKGLGGGREMECREWRGSRRK